MFFNTNERVIYFNKEDKVMNEFFYCYSVGLKHFLKIRHISFISTGKHPNGNRYWTYEKTDALTKALDEWNIYKQVFPKV